MEYRELYKEKLQENHDLKTQIDILETILRSYIPVIGKKEENQYEKSIINLYKRK